MNDVLSNDEVAALVEAAKQGQTDAEPTHKRRARRVRDIDFSRPSKFAQDQQRRLERAHESFARTAGQRLSGVRPAQCGGGLKRRSLDLCRSTEWRQRGFGPAAFLRAGWNA